MDQFIFKNNLKWIPYNKFENIEYLDKSGFSTLYKATYKDIEVVLKCLNYLNDSDEILKKFLNEQKIIGNLYDIISIFGFTKNPNNLDYMLITEYANKGNLRGCLTEIANSWEQKLFMLYKIIKGLNDIHKENLIHHDFHDGNILCIKYKDNIYGVCISDYLGSYQSAISFSKKDNIYGVIPFIAPEVLKDEIYTQASDIYSFCFSMIMWELTSGIPPFNNRAHDLQLALSICKGERPEIIENTPQCYVDLMEKCWDEDPLKRPSASEILDIIKNWIFRPDKINEINEKLKKDIMEFITAPIGNKNLITESHPQAYNTSRLLDFTSGELNKVLNFFEKKKEEVIQEFFKLEKTAETYYQNSQNGLKEKQIELDALQQKNSQFEQDIQILKLTIAIQIKESAEIKNTLQTQIIHLQNEIYEKQAPASNLTEQLKQNKLISLEVQAHIDQLEHEKINLQEKLTQTETNIRELKFQQESLIEQKEQLENELNRSQDKCEQIEQKRIELYNMVRDLSIEQKLSTELKAKLEEEINQLEQKLNNKKQIKEQLVHALQIKKDKINELEQRLIILDNERIRKLKDKTNELSKIEKELINKLTSGENTKEVHKEKEAKEKELDELKKELSRTDTNRKKRVLEQINKFMESKSDFLSLREEVIKKLQNCCDRLESSIAVNNGDKYTKEFQNILVKYNDGLLKLNKGYDSLMNVIQKK
ncbi:hypothetical protein RclHR1_09220002 [Rhizophagus clarus]|uniref:Protein kinase domain-containing protein n=1 Tax=Rhizophagus clarus TaxID=94130 RepID=A0A2Z6S3V9_9GLOM|nr:hypothetical protein RclHR1_09220002 [Rhizophagus clarus]